MSAEVSSMPNGSYVPQHGFDQQQANNAYASQNYNQAPAASSNSASTATPQPEIPKDEVGWYFVEQYYTTLSRTPEKLYLYYNKRSQFVSGNETEKVNVCIGQRAINDRIKELEFQDCKVRITNVDSQASDINIVIQVIGEISNKSQPHRKFTQTFVLATQTNGYFVLNDIFRYMIEEEEETAVAEPTKEAEEEVQQEPAAEKEVEEPAPVAVEESEPKTLTSSEDKAAVEHDAQTVDKQIEEKIVKEEPKEEEAAPAVNGTEETKEEEAPAEQVAAEEAVPEPEQEKPRDPEPTPVSEEPPKVTKPAAPAAPAKPAVPKTWASLAASANKSVAMPAAPTPSAPAQAAKPAAAPKAAPAAAAPQAASPAPAAQREASPAAATSGDEWTAVSGSHNRQQSRQVNGQQQQQQQEPSHPRGYIKNVQENIKGPEMKEKLSQFGEITHFDIYRAKNCAFVDFKTHEGYKAAIAASPFQIGEEKFWIEERRNAGPGGNRQQQGFQGGRGGFQQGGSQRGRGNFDGGRGGRGGFGQRGGRGGAGGSVRGRGGAAPAA
ncbi:hypothetical protein Q7P36_008661 [Cladosporium allicinum]